MASPRTSSRRSWTRTTSARSPTRPRRSEGPVARRCPTGSASSCEIIDDGRHRRNTIRYPWQSGMIETVVSNGVEVVDYSSSAQSNIYGPRSRATHEVLGLRDICTRPWVVARGRGRNHALGKVRREESGGRLTVEEATTEYTARWVVDRRTGFVHADSTRMTTRGINDEIIRQYGPKTVGDGGGSCRRCTYPRQMALGSPSTSSTRSTSSIVPLHSISRWRCRRGR